MKMNKYFSAMILGTALMGMASCEPVSDPLEKEQYQKECEKHNSEFNTSKCKFDKTEEKVQIPDNQKN